MGGTSADYRRRPGRPAAADDRRSTWNGHCPISFPSIDVISIGAGGGSIAWLDSGRLPAQRTRIAPAPTRALRATGKAAPSRPTPTLTWFSDASATICSSTDECSCDVELAPRRAACADRGAARAEPRRGGRGRSADREREHGQGDPPADGRAGIRPARVQPRRLRRGRAATCRRSRASSSRCRRSSSRRSPE